MAIVTMLLVGCGSGGASSSSGDNDGGIVLKYNLTSTYSGKQENSSNSKAMSAFSLNSTSVYNGQILVKNLDTNEENTLDWYASVNKDDFSITSSKTVVLKPANYQFFLLLNNGDRQYLSSEVFEVRDGVTSDITLDVKPLIGTLLTDVSQVKNIPAFKFRYDTNDLTSYESPKLSLGIDSEDTISYDINPTTGLSDLYINLDEGAHSVTLDFYNGNIYLGKSTNYPATINVEPNVDINLDLVPLQSQTSFSMNNNGGDLNISLTIPTHVITEVKSLANLKTILRYSGENNQTGEQEVDVYLDNSIYKADINLSTIYYGDLTLSLEFMDKNASDEIIGSCDIHQISISNQNQTIQSTVNLKRRAFLTGNLLSTIAINVYDENQSAVEGALIYANGDLLGITSDGTLTTKGYFKDNLKKGSYNIKAIKGEKEVIKDINISALQVYNLDLILAIVEQNESEEQNISLPTGEIQVNSYTNGNQRNPNIAKLNSGDLIVTWMSVGQDGDGSGIYQQRFNSNLDKIADEILVNSTRAKNQLCPSITSINQDRYVISWYSAHGSIDVYMQIFDNNSNKVGDEVLVNSFTNMNQTNSYIEKLDNNTFVVSWSSYHQDGDSWGIYMQIFDNNGLKIGNERQVNTNTQFMQWKSNITNLNNDTFIISWRQNNSNDDGLFLQQFDYNGNKIGNQIKTNSGDITISSSSIMQLNDELLVTWSSASLENIIGQKFNLNLEKLGNSFSLHASTFAKGTIKTIQMNQNEYILIWEEFGYISASLGTQKVNILEKRFDTLNNTIKNEIIINDFYIDNLNSLNVIKYSNENIILVGDSNSIDGSGDGVYLKAYE